MRTLLLDGWDGPAADVQRLRDQRARCLRITRQRIECLTLEAMASRINRRARELRLPEVTPEELDLMEHGQHMPGSLQAIVLEMLCDNLDTYARALRATGGMPSAG